MPTISDTILQLGTNYLQSRWNRQSFDRPVYWPGVAVTDVPNSPVPPPSGGGGGGMTVAPDCGDGSCGSPRYLTYDCKTGEYRRKRRRRRRSMLTKGDMTDLQFIGGLKNNDNVKMALAKRIKGG